MPKTDLSEITKAEAKGLEPGLWWCDDPDGELTGFGLRVSPDGKARTWFVQFKSPATGRYRRMRIGPLSSHTPRQAAAKALTILGQVEHGGRDPLQERKDQAAKATEERRTVNDALDGYLAEAAKRTTANRGPLRPATMRQYREVADRHIRPALGQVKLAKLTRKRVNKWHAELVGRSVFRANLARLVLRKTVARELKSKAIEADPTEDIERQSEPKRIDRGDVALDDLQAERLRRALDSFKGEYPIKVRAIELLVLTGWRSGEVRTLRWEDVDIGARSAKLRDTKTAPIETRRFSEAAAAVLHELLEIREEDSTPFGKPRPMNPFVFPGRKPGAPVSTLDRVWSRVIRPAAGLDVDRPDIGRVRLHDLRHNFITRALTVGGLAPHEVSKLVGHVDMRTTLAYLSRDADAELEAADKAAAVVWSRPARQS